MTGIVDLQVSGAEKYHNNFDEMFMLCESKMTDATKKLGWFSVNGIWGVTLYLDDVPVTNEKLTQIITKLAQQLWEETQLKLEQVWKVYVTEKDIAHLTHVPLHEVKAWISEPTFPSPKIVLDNAIVLAGEQTSAVLLRNWEDIKLWIMKHRTEVLPADYETYQELSHEQQCFVDYIIATRWATANVPL